MTKLAAGELTKIGAIFRTAREDKQITFQELSTALMIPTKTLGNVEAGNRASIPTHVKLAKYLGIHFIIGDSGTEGNVVDVADTRALGVAIRETRVKKGYASQVDLSKVAGVKPYLISHLESGSTEVSLFNYVTICKILGIDLSVGDPNGTEPERISIQTTVPSNSSKGKKLNPKVIEKLSKTKRTKAKLPLHDAADQLLDIAAQLRASNGHLRAKELTYSLDIGDKDSPEGIVGIHIIFGGEADNVITT